MKNLKSGFTLVEILGVIIILSFILLAIIPNINNLLNGSRNKLYNEQIEEIKAATKSWSAVNSNNLPASESESITVTLYQLKMSGFVPYNIKNPKTGDLFSDDMTVEISKKGMNYFYEITDFGDTNVQIDPNSPQIILNGSIHTYSEIGDSYTDAGAQYKDVSGIYILIESYTIYDSEDNQIAEIPTDTIGEYYIEYSATINELTSTIKRQVTIRDTIAPVIAITGYQNNICQNIDANVVRSLPSGNDISVTDNSNELIEATIIGNFSYIIPGIKKIQYVATDPSGNIGTFDLCLNVVDNTAPTLTISNITTTYNSSNTSATVTVSTTDTGVGLHQYAYSFDNGNNWQSSNIYKVETNETLLIRVRDKVLNQSSTITIPIVLIPSIYTFNYIGSSQSFTVPKTGWYLFELWGAQGGAVTSNLGGKGAYVKGKILLNKDEILYVFVGSKGGSEATITNIGGYNGGGFSGNNSGAQSFGGGGATDIRLVDGLWNSFESLNSRIIIAAGGGGATTGSTTVAGAGGDLIGNKGTASNSTYNTSTYLPLGGNQTAGGFGYNFRDGSYGFSMQTNPTAWGGGGGSGYYGGGTGNGTTGAGGSSFVSGYAGVNAILSSSSSTPTNNTLHYSGKYFIAGSMSSGINTENGKAIITYLTGETIEKTISTLNNVRYIKDCINGSSANTNNHWVEIQAIYQGINVALNKTVVGTVSESASYPYSRIVDGDLTSTNYAGASTTGLQCVTVNLGQVYNLDEITVWHYWLDSRSYNSNVTYVSSDNTNWTTIINTGSQAETTNGKRINAYQ